MKRTISQIDNVHEVQQGEKRECDGNAAHTDTSTNRKSAKERRAEVFTITTDEKNCKLATCTLCSQIIKMANSNTSGLIRHLERVHPQTFSEVYPDGTKLKQTGSKTRRVFSQDEFKNILVDWAAKKYLPFSFFDDEPTQELFHYINPNVIIPTRAEFRSNTLLRFLRIQNVVMETLQANGSKISFTVDAWTSVSNKSYYAVTGHFIDDQWNIQSLVIDFVASNGSHSGKDIATIFYNVVKEYGLLNKVQGITVDNASANTRFLAELAPLMRTDNVSFDPINQHFRCFAHVINLAVNDMLRLVQTNIDGLENQDEEHELNEEEQTNYDDCTRVLTKLKKLFQKIKYSEQWTSKLQSCCETTNTKMLSPNLGVATRWNSTCDIVHNALQMKQALNLLCENNASLNVYKISESEWSVLAELIKFLRHFKVLSCGEKYVTLPLVVIGINMMQDKLEEYIQSYAENESPSPVDDVMYEAVVAARDKLVKHYVKTNWMYCVILILDPRHKIVTFEYTIWGKEMAKESIKQFELIYRTKSFDPKMLNATTLPTCSAKISASSISTFDTCDDLFDLESLFACNNSSESSDPSRNWRKELDDYLSLNRADKSTKVLTWWSEHEKTFPILAEMARDFFSIQATSVPVERFFSKASLVIRKHRNRLNDESARNLLCLNSWRTCSLSSQIIKKASLNEKNGQQTL